MRPYYSVGDWLYESPYYSDAKNKNNYRKYIKNIKYNKKGKRKWAES